MIKTDLPQNAASTLVIHDRYKDLAEVEQAFRTRKTAHFAATGPAGWFQRFSSSGAVRVPQRSMVVSTSAISQLGYHLRPDLMQNTMIS